MLKDGVLSLIDIVPYSLFLDLLSVIASSSKTFNHKFLQVQLFITLINRNITITIKGSPVNLKINYRCLLANSG